MSGDESGWQLTESDPGVFTCARFAPQQADAARELTFYACALNFLSDIHKQQRTHHLTLWHAQ